MKIPGTVLFSFSFGLLSAQSVTTMTVEKTEKEEMNMEELQQAEHFKSAYYEPAIYPGGTSALKEYIAKNLNQQVANDLNTYGAVYVSFVLDTSGSVTNVKIMRGLHSALDAEAIRVVSSLPKWTPGRVDGKKELDERWVQVMFKQP